MENVERSLRSLVTNRFSAELGGQLVPSHQESRLIDGEHRPYRCFSSRFRNDECWRSNRPLPIYGYCQRFINGLDVV